MGEENGEMGEVFEKDLGKEKRKADGLSDFSVSALSADEAEGDEGDEDKSERK